MSLESYRTAEPYVRIASVLAMMIVAGCASTPPSGAPASTGAAAVTDAGPPSASASPSADGDTASRLGAMRQRMDMMRSQLDAIGGAGSTPQASEMQGMMDQMSSSLTDMESMMDEVGTMTPNGMRPETMVQMQQMMGDMEGIAERMQQMMGAGGMSGMMSGNHSVDEMMQMMRSMHQQLDQRLATPDPHHPTPSPTAGG